MRYFKLVLILLIAAFMLVPSQDAMAKRRKKKKQEPLKEEKQKKDPGLTHGLGLYGGLGYSNFMHNVEGTKAQGGVGGILGIQYMLKKHKPGDMNPKNMFTFSIGIEPEFLNSTTKLNDFNLSGDYNYDLGDYKDVLLYNMAFSKYYEGHNRLSVNVPIMFGGQFGRYYFQAGAKAGVGLWGGYSQNATITRTLTDPELVDETIQIVPTHSLDVTKMKSSGSLKFDLDVTVSAEFGIVMDEWMPASAMMITKGKGKKKKTTQMSYRLGLFVDYGIMNLNPDYGSQIMSTNEHTDPLLAFNYSYGSSIPGPSKTNPTPELKSINYESVSAKSILASDYWTEGTNKLNSLIVGAKFTVLFQVTPVPPPVKKKPRPRPKPKQVKVPTYPPFFYCQTLNAETDEIIPATVTLIRTTGAKDTAFVAKLDPTVGVVQNQMNSEKFLITVKCRGFMDWNDTVYQIDNDTIYAELTPIHKNAVVILRNLLFDTDKTIIKNTSVQSLEDLYKLLSENPTLKIQITGHTDNVGKDAYNQKLSEGRAKAVFNEMVKRGIDPRRMTWRGAGEAEPIESNDTPEGRAENRRVEFMIL